MEALLFLLLKTRSYASIITKQQNTDRKEDREKVFLSHFPDVMIA